jgi:hypothetical protein
MFIVVIITGAFIFTFGMVSYLLYRHSLRRAKSVASRWCRS